MQDLKSWRQQPQRATRVLTEAASAADATALLKQMHAAEVEINAFHYCATMSVCTKTSQWPWALQHFSLGASSDVFLANAALSAFAASGRWAAALQLLSSLKTVVRLDIVSFNALGSCHWRCALDLPDGDLTPTAVTFNCSMAGQRWPLALQTFGAMCRLRCSNEATPTTVISSFHADDAANMEKMQAWQAALCRTWLPDWMTGYNAALSLCETWRRWDLAIALLHPMADVVSFSSVISTCEKAGRWQLTLLILDMMRCQKVRANNFSYNAAMSACGKHSAWSKALELFDEMIRFQIQEDVVSYNALLEALVEGQTDGRLEGPSVALLLTSMTEALVLPNLITYSTALMGFEKDGRWEEGLHLLRLMRMKLIELDIISYNSAMSACKVASQWQTAWQLLRSIATTATSATSISFCTLCAACERQWRFSIEALHWAEDTTGATVPMAASALLACERAAVVQPTVALIHSLGQDALQDFPNAGMKVTLQT